jgi:hypothetical protein
MKKYLLILILVFISPAVFAQWSGEVNLSQFTVQSQSQLNACVDVNGIHLVYWRNGGIKYARANYNGSTVYYYDRVIENEGSNCNFVNIVSVNNSTLYAIYKKNNTINVKWSVNLGSSWSQYSYRLMTNTGCDKVIAYGDGGDIHIGWTEYKGNPEYHYDSYYIKFTPGTPPVWSYYKEVTDQELYGGKDPDLAISSNKIHYFYKDGSTDSHSRDKVKTNPNWDNSQYIPFNGTSIEYHKPIIANNEVNAAFRVYYSTFEVSGTYISNSDRPFDQGFWNENVYLRESEIGYETEVESTVDNKIHFIYFDKNDNKWQHRYISNSTLSGQIGEIPLVAYPSSTLLANSNDLYLSALGSINVPAWIKLQRYDASPAPPVNLTISKSVNNHPLLNWSPNMEPDRNYYKIYRWDSYGGGWQYLNQTSSTSYEDQTLDYCTATPPAQCPDERQFSFRITAIDLNSHESDPSNVVSTKLVGGPPSKITGEESTVYEYSLGQNYPNPFNPMTNIDYTIKSSGLVMLKVYDILGTEVISLVNESKEPGNYSVEFDGSDLPSGMYVYQLITDNFMDSKKLILMK